MPCYCVENREHPTNAREDTMASTGTMSKTQVHPVNEVLRQSLKAGDIIATREHSVGSAGVRFFAGQEASHAILYTGNVKGIHFAVDAMPKDGVTKDQLQFKLNPSSYAVVFRHRTATPNQCARACQWAELQAAVHKPYDFKSPVRVSALKYSGVGQLVILADEVEAWRSPEGEDASFMCSELVFRAFEIAGAPLTDKPAYAMSPASLFHTDKLKCMGRLI
jgi:uncharacterized protein YycO